MAARRHIIAEAEPSRTKHRFKIGDVVMNGPWVFRITKLRGIADDRYEAEVLLAGPAVSGYKFVPGTLDECQLIDGYDQGRPFVWVVVPPEEVGFLILEAALRNRP